MPTTDLKARSCTWCEEPLQGQRSDATYCTPQCRQAAWRFARSVGRAPAVAGGHPLRLAYADQPYPGKARRYYSSHRDYAGEVDHATLIASLADFDGWALSTSAAALPAVLALCPPAAKVAVWSRGIRPTARDVIHAGWEPVTYVCGRHLRSVEAVTGQPRRVDVLTHHPTSPTTDPDRMTGAKPAAFARWIFDLLGALPGEHFTDLFPGSGAVTRAWDLFTGDTAQVQA